jgi:carbon storage regulator
VCVIKFLGSVTIERTVAERGGGMLVLSRKKNESIVIDENVVITIIEVRGDKVRLGIQAPRDVAVHRQEVLEAILAEKVKLSNDSTEDQSA